MTASAKKIIGGIATSCRIIDVVASTLKEESLGVIIHTAGCPTSLRKSVCTKFSANIRTEKCGSKRPPSYGITN